MSSAGLVILSLGCLAAGVMIGLWIHHKSRVIMTLVSGIAVGAWFGGTWGVPIPIPVALVVLGYAWARITTKLALTRRAQEQPGRGLKS